MSLLEGPQDPRPALDFVQSVPWWFYNLSNVGVQDTCCSMEDEDPPEMVLRRADDLLAHGFGTAPTTTTFHSETASTLPFTARQGALTFRCQRWLSSRLLFLRQICVIVSSSIIQQQYIRVIRCGWLFLFVNLKLIRSFRTGARHQAVSKTAST